jgi:hypothetical protein
MANAALYVSWGQAVRGRETKALECFMRTMEYYAGLQKQGKIAAHRTYITETGHLAHRGGFMIIEGDVAQLRALVDSEEYKSLLFQAYEAVEGIEVNHLATGDEVQKSVGRIVAARKQLGITT